LTVTAVPVLHIPDEPIALAERWLGAVLDGQALEDVIGDEQEGIAAWFWSRWRTLASAGMNEEQLGQVVLAYRRELWLWLAGERTWAQCCSGLVGRINRQLASGDVGTQG
jgi:hypothetical protein